MILLKNTNKTNKKINIVLWKKTAFINWKKLLITYQVSNHLWETNKKFFKIIKKKNNFCYLKILKECIGMKQKKNWTIYRFYIASVFFLSPVNIRSLTVSIWRSQCDVIIYFCAFCLVFKKKRFFLRFVTGNKCKCGFNLYFIYFSIILFFILLILLKKTSFKNT